MTIELAFLHAVIHLYFCLLGLYIRFSLREERITRSRKTDEIPPYGDTSVALYGK